MPTQGLYYPSKVVQVPLDLSRTVSTPFSLDPTYSLPSSQVWYIQPNGSGSKLRVQDPLLFNNDPTIIWSTTSAAVLGASFSGMIQVTVTSGGTNWPAGTPDIGPLWINTAFIGGVTTTSSGATRILLGTNGPAEFITVSETEAAVNAAINAAAASKSPDTLVNVVPAGTTQGTATRVPIVRGQGNYAVFIGGISAPAANGIRIEMVAEDGTTVIPSVIGTEVTIYNNASLQTFVNVYPQSGGAINAAGVDVPYALDRSGIFTLICTAANVWAIKNNEFGKIEADIIYQNNTAAQLLLGDPAGQGVFIDALGAAPVQLAIRDQQNGFSVGGAGLLQGFQSSVPAFTLQAASTFIFGGGDPGQEGKVLSLPFDVVATDPPVEIPPYRRINITGATGVNPGIRFNGDPGDESVITNGALVDIDALTVGGTAFTVVAAGDASLVVSNDGGTKWGLVATFTAPVA